MSEGMCNVQWIDCSGDPTPDNSPAIAFAWLKTDPGTRRPICAAHLETLIKGKVHHDRHCNHYPQSEPVLELWDFEMIETPGKE